MIFLQNVELVSMNVSIQYSGIYLLVESGGLMLHVQLSFEESIVFYMIMDLLEPKEFQKLFL